MVTMNNTTFQLCNTEFWNNNLTWFTERPQITSCFRDTFLTWVPAIFFLFALFAECFSIRSSKLQSIPWNCFNRFRLSVTFILVLSKFCELLVCLNQIINPKIKFNDNSIDSHISSLFYYYYQYSTSENVIATSTVIAPLIQLSCHLALFTLYISHRRSGLHTSGSIWFYLLILSLCESIKFYSLILSHGFNSPDLTDIFRFIYLPPLLILFILEIQGDTPRAIIELDPSDIEQPISPEYKASFVSFMTGWWFNKFVFNGYKTELKLENVWRLPSRLKVASKVPSLERLWYSPASTLSSGNRTFRLRCGSLQKVSNVCLIIGKLIWFKLLLAGCLKLIQDLLVYVKPLILKELIKFISNKDDPFWHGILFAALMLVIPTIQSWVMATYIFKTNLLGLEVGMTLIGSIYRKSLNLSASSRLKSSTGEIVNLMSVDTARFSLVFNNINLLWSSPLQMILATYLLHLELGNSVFVGLSVMVLLLPCNIYISRMYRSAQASLMNTKDTRIKQINEILNGIKVIKLYAWENSFIDRLLDLRDKELRFTRKILTLDAILSFLWLSSPLIVAMISFAIYVSADERNILTPEKAFVSIAYFNLLKFPINNLPYTINAIIVAIVSGKRLSNFLNSDELIQYVSRQYEPDAITIENGTLIWSEPGKSREEDGAEFSTLSPSNIYEIATLKDINLKIRPRDFCAIVGQVASGKSSLIAAIIGEMHRISGRFNICKDLKLAYVPQQAWIQNMTVRQNILFGMPYDEAKYQRILSACSLQADLELLPAGDLSEIGEKGINLSGGQKQRISIARACYADSDVYLLDDPLSALDSHVAKHVFEKVLCSKNGLLRNKTRILATNSLFVLPNVDQIVCLEKGRIVESGTYSELISLENGIVAECMRRYSGNQESKKLDEVTSNQRKPIDEIAPRDVQQVIGQGLETKNAGKLINDEEVESGKVTFKVYLEYFRANSWLWISIAFTTMVIATGLNVASNLWLALWSSDADDPKRATDSDTRRLRLIVYGALGGLQCFTILIGNLASCAGAVKCAKYVHSKLLEKIMHSPMNFFDTTPMGRVVNRFSKDIETIDTSLPISFRQWLGFMLLAVSTIIVICYSFPAFILFILPCSVLYFLIQKIYIATTRQLRRYESQTRSPIFSNFSETLSGTSIIRAYNCSERFVEKSDQAVDLNNSCVYPSHVANRWLSFRLEFIGNMITAGASLFAVYHRGVISASIAGLTISYSLNITQILNWLVSTVSQLETQIISVERVLQYKDLKQEDSWIKDENRPPIAWPSKGEIDIDNYSTKYREDTGLVLKDLTLNIRPREKIGIVGRTGSGKSSLTLSLFRVLEPSSGKILIDDLDIGKLGLHDLRSKLTIIPQDPVLFAGTVRFNLDPTNNCSDAELWRALDLSHLKKYIMSQDSGLDFLVSEYGENFSVGQRQLICLARAILRKSKILILDEATASVDLETDSIVQKTIREIFDNCTIVTIAHRLHTILDSDRVLVLDKGSIVELDDPKKLVSDPKSAFAALIRDANVDISSLIEISEE